MPRSHYSVWLVVYVLAVAACTGGKGGASAGKGGRGGAGGGTAGSAAGRGGDVGGWGGGGGGAGNGSAGFAGTVGANGGAGASGTGEAGGGGTTGGGGIAGGSGIAGGGGITGGSGTTGGGGIVGGSSGGIAGGAGTGTAGTGGVAGTGGSAGGLATDFPAAPILGTGVPSDAPSRFGTPTGPGPCVTEPEDGTLFPNNWLRPRVRVPGTTGLLKITFHAAREANDLVVYASGEVWALPKTIWSGLASHVIDEDVTITVQAETGGATTVKFRIAPAAASGSVVFLSADPTQMGKVGIETLAPTAIADDGVLRGFGVADESTVETLKITNVAQQGTRQDGRMQGSHCIGCHTGTPDGDFVSFVDAWPWSAAFAGVKPGAVGVALPGYAGGSCTSWNECTTPRTYVQLPWMGPMTFSLAHWQTGDRIAIVATQLRNVAMAYMEDNWQPGRLAWVDLESTATTLVNGLTVPVQGQAFGVLARTGDPRPAAAFPTWSHDGNSIVYSSTACPNPGQRNGCGTVDGRLYKGATDLYEIPFAGKVGGAATPVPGAATTTLEEYYAAFSPDDRMLAYNAVPAGQEMYANPSAELYVVARGQSAATRLRANTPPACSGKSSPGVNNHWPRWAPQAVAVGGSRYYWIVFSSNRYGLAPVTTNFNNTSKVVELSQLYVTAVVVDAAGTTTFPAIYLWNQPQNRTNLTPAWDNFHIPAVVD